MKIEEAISYFEQQEIECKETLEWALVNLDEEEMIDMMEDLAIITKEMEAVRIALKALRRMQDSECNDKSDGQ